MERDPKTPMPDSDVQAILRDELARGDLALVGAGPLLAHLLLQSGTPLVNEALVARVRGMLEGLARQLAVTVSSGSAEPVDKDWADIVTDLAEELANLADLRAFCLSTALEAYLAQKLQRRHSIEPLLTPLLQELIAADDTEQAELAMQAMAAQSRFLQAQDRMTLPLNELPAEQFHAVLATWQDFARKKNRDLRLQAIEKLRQDYDEGATRVALFTRVISKMRGGELAALELDHAGLSFFVSALSRISDQSRNLAISACHESQGARLALALRCASLTVEQIQRQFDLLGHDQSVPEDIEQILPDEAHQLLRDSDAGLGR